ncbi:hypothetical protein ABE85_24920 [Mitsuaria sp. 7]|nr:hypothetical protein ABE85_24920 [Mitsuaria sp. 7]
MATGTRDERSGTSSTNGLEGAAPGDSVADRAAVAATAGRGVTGSLPEETDGPAAVVGNEEAWLCVWVWEVGLKPNMRDAV